ncbi:hypothetical protein E2C01_051102 [Portunus trituberculatus]|uniref:Uncharacterized protein n=1 Tax=Portunus trituberculatus TaxID=210409 RepID=A0A5B7GIN1_PORTR|nr:hypothetical protein [Portunus trituberculatus]
MRVGKASIIFFPYFFFNCFKLRGQDRSTHHHHCHHYTLVPITITITVLSAHHHHYCYLSQSFTLFNTITTTTNTFTTTITAIPSPPVLSSITKSHPFQHHHHYHHKHSPSSPTLHSHHHQHHNQAPSHILITHTANSHTTTTTTTTTTTSTYHNLLLLSIPLFDCGLLHIQVVSNNGLWLRLRCPGGGLRLLHRRLVHDKLVHSLLSFGKELSTCGKRIRKGLESRGIRTTLTFACGTLHLRHNLADLGAGGDCLFHERLVVFLYGVEVLHALWTHQELHRWFLEERHKLLNVVPAEGHQQRLTRWFTQSSNNIFVYKAPEPAPS